MKKQTDNSPKPKKIPRKITTQEPPKVVEKEPEQSQQIEVDICTNRFIVETDAFDAYAVNSFALPKMLFTQQKLKEKSTIGFELFFVNKPENQPKKILNAAKNGIKKLKLLFIDSEGEVSTTWNFIDPKIIGIDFGVVSYEQNGEEETDWNKIKIEVEYENFSIDAFEV